VPDERWSTAQVAALAPDSGSMTGARRVGTPGHWQEPGRLADVLWGLCKGSGKNPYQVCVDLSGPAYKCSCPSRKFPCKHALGLLLLWAEGAPVSAETPAFAAEWMAARAARATATPRAASAPDLAAAAKRSAQRGERVAAGMTELRRWLDDQVQQGLAGAEQAGHRPFETMAARLIDAQAPTAASAVRRLGGIAGVGPQWADRLLGELGLLRLLVSGHARLDTLPDPLAATVRGRIGFPVSTEEVLAGPQVRDTWQVLGQVDSDDGALMTRRSWLSGVTSGRFALLLSFAAPGQSLATEVVPGTSFDASLCFYPGAAPLRALVATRHEAVVPLVAPAGALPMRSALAGWSAALAAEPWRYDSPVLLADVVPSGGGWLTDAAGESLPLAAGHREPWWLLAAAGAAPATVAAEWSPGGLRPLAAWADGRYVPAAPPGTDSGAQRSPELPPDLLAAALVGTARRPWTASSVRIGDRALVTAGSGISSGGSAGSPASSGSPASPGGSAAGLLEAAAAALIYRRAAVTPAVGHSPVSAAPAETDRPLPTAAGARLLRILSDGGTPGGAHATQELLSQWLGAAARHGGFVPPEALPALLDMGRRDGAIRPALGRVAGRRGAWLAGLRADWRWLLDEAPGGAAADDPAVWETGSAGERLAHLTRLRGTDAGAARALLEGTWATESPEERARFVAALATGLSQADDAFLESALDDRRKEVREAALELLRKLPGSALSRRMTERARTAVRIERRPLGPDRLLVDPPQTLDPSLRRDGVGAVPVRGTGVGAWLLEEVVAGTPLNVWTDTFGHTPADIVDLARGHDWESPLLHGWAKAAIVHSDSRWAEALLAADSRRGAAGLREAVRWLLHLILPPAELGRLAAEALRREDHVAHRLLAVHPGHWPDELALAVTETIAHRARTDRHSWQLGELCRAAAMAMPTSYATAIGQLAVQLDQEPADLSRVRPVAELARTLTFRHEMLQEFETP